MLSSLLGGFVLLLLDQPASQPARTHDQQHDLDGAGEGSIASLSLVACLTHTYPGG